MSLSTYYWDYGRHVARLRRRRRRRAYAPTSNAASHGKHEKINSWVSFPFLYQYVAPFGGPSGRRSSPIRSIACLLWFYYPWAAILRPRQDELRISSSKAIPGITGRRICRFLSENFEPLDRCDTWRWWTVVKGVYHKRQWLSHSGRKTNFVVKSVKRINWLV